MEPKLLNFYDNELNAQEIKVKLAEAGIECLLKDELNTAVNPFMEPSEYGVAVYVDRKGALRA